MNYQISTKSIAVLIVALCLAVLPVLVGCGGSDTVLALSATERYELGMKKFHDGDFLEAYGEFNTIKLQYPGSTVADSAQFYMGESRYRREEYLIAAEDFMSVKRNYPASPLLAEAQYKVGLCYYSLVPRSTLDQRYTARAIDEFQAFLEYYPTHPLAEDAAARIQELNNKMAQKDFETAELYMKMEYYKAATYYYNSVFEKYHDTQFGEQALLGKVRALIARKKFDDAAPDIDRFKELYPKSPRLGDLLLLEKELLNRSGGKNPSGKS